MAEDDNPTRTQFEPLVELGSPVTMSFRGRSVPAYGDLASGYVFFKPPPPDELDDYYQREYPRMQAQTGYYTIEADYAAGKNDYYAGRILGGLYRAQASLAADRLGTRLRLWWPCCGNDPARRCSAGIGHQCGRD